MFLLAFAVICVVTCFLILLFIDSTDHVSWVPAVVMYLFWGLIETVSMSHRLKIMTLVSSLWR